ncbi:MAG TPA: hypothetical protein H9667_01600 [Firmicutes bacterium]|nr:hypothetical protein [Bacillota bacterium]
MTILEIKVNVEAPALVGVLERFVNALEKGQALNVLQGADKEIGQVNSKVQTVPVQQQMSIQQPPVQPAPVQTVPVQQAPAQQQPTTVPTQAPTYSLDQLAKAGTTLMNMGEAKRSELMNLLAMFGVQALTELAPDQYGAFATKLRELGAQI